MKAPKIGIIIQARTNSSRLPQKVIKPFWQEQSILDIVISQLKKLRLPIVLATTTSKEDQVIVDVARAHQIGWYCGDEADVLQRFLDVITRERFDFVFRICADNPFLSIELMEELLARAEALSFNFDYLSHKWKETPAILTHFGVFSELASSKALASIKQLATDSTVYEHVTYFLYTNPAIFKSEFLAVEKSFFTYVETRLTVDTPTDFKVAQQIFEALNKQGKAPTIEAINSYIVEQDAILPLMQSQIETNKKS
ncbi:MAG: hypothetical protein AAF798_14290 [Bacteroidota bacterium]